MSHKHARQSSSINQTIKKFFLSAFVIFSFAAYAIHQRFSYPDLPLKTTSAVPTANVQSVPSQMANIPTIPTDSNASPAQQPEVPLPSPTVAPASSGRYKDGTYAGPEVNAYYGWVRIQATIRNGNIEDVQFLEYPNDRRTSVRINRIAVPYLQQEAIQAQTANVDLISGATLTSRAFVISLSSALQSAQN